MARKSTLKMTSEVGESAEAKISVMVGVGLKNEQILATFEMENPSIIPEKDARRKVEKMPPFDALLRQRIQEQIRSVRHMMTTDDQELSDMIELNGISSIMSIDKIPLMNIERFSCGNEAIDHIYGETEHIYLDGKTKGNKTGKVSKGMPESFLSIWAGSPGVGKSRLAIAITKASNKLGRKVLYYNGEADPSQFRVWCGTDIDPNLFLVRSSESLRLDAIVQDIYKYKPALVFIDSMQMIAEAQKGSRGLKMALSRFKLLKGEAAAGKPHIIFISQLNKKGEVMGSRYLEHMVDFVARVQKMEGMQGQFLFECPTKNRGGATPRSAVFAHKNGTVECMSRDYIPRGLSLIQNDVNIGPEPIAIIRPLPADTGLANDFGEGAEEAEPIEDIED